MDQCKATAVPDADTVRPERGKRTHRGQPRRQPRYNVILWNDDDHTYEYVICMLQKLFACRYFSYDVLLLVVCPVLVVSRTSCAVVEGHSHIIVLVVSFLMVLPVPVPVPVLVFVLVLLVKR